jgi:hypothetical protein
MTDGTQEAPVSFCVGLCMFAYSHSQVLLETVNYERLVGQGRYQSRERV